jgi:hypothetical protein
MKNLLKKLFCLHKWKSYARTTYNWKEHSFYYGGYQDASSTTEILICTKCGKIKTIKY